jgi:hypothetical protein
MSVNKSQTSSLALSLLSYIIRLFSEHTLSFSVVPLGFDYGRPGLFGFFPFYT